jgi:chitodextrinase
MSRWKNAARTAGRGRSVGALLSAGTVVASLLLAASPAVGASAPVDHSPAAAPAPIGQWPLDEGTGTTGHDAVGGNDAKLSGGATWTAGASGSAVKLNGTNGVLDTGAAVLQMDKSFTVVAVVEFDAVPTRNATVMGQDSDSGHGAFFLQYVSANKRFAMTTGGATAVDTGPAPVAGRWYQLVGVYDAEAKTVDLYVNGTLAATKPQGSARQDGKGDLVFGRGQFNGSGADFWPGAVDEVSVYQDALTADQVVELPSTPVHATEAVIDASGRTVHLTLSSEITAAPASSAAGFAIVNGADPIPVSSVATDPSDSHSLVLTTSRPLAFSSYTVKTTVSYDGSGGLAAANEAVGAFSLNDLHIVNNVSSSNPVYLSTPWSDQVDVQNPLPDYPRPQLTRTDWKSLNGEWQFEGSGNDLTPSFGTELAGKIVVPYPMESTLSRVGKHYDHSLYRRTFSVPDGWKVGSGNRLLLNFGAIDYQSTVYVNGVKVATHTGGYTAFTADVTDALKPGTAQEIVVAVTDTTTQGQSLGKQASDPSGSQYTSTSGIWQTVWMEPVPIASIDSVTVIPDALDNTISVTVNSASSTSGAVTVKVATSDDAANGTNTQSTGVQVASGAGRVNSTFAIHVKNPHLWTPDDPYLYNLTITLTDGKSVDAVGSYTGIRTIGVTKVGGVNKVVLNGKPIFLMGTLDQGFYPDGLYTPATDAALKFPLQSMKDLGFNLDRAHLKVDPARYYYWADKLGMMVMQDAPSTAYYGGPAPSAANLAQWETELHAIVEQLISSPSVVVWTPYNEHDGETSVAVTGRVAADIKALDPSRLVDANSGANVFGVGDSGAGDLIDDHAYPGPAHPQPDATRAAIDGEHGGLRIATPGHVWTTPGKSDPVLCVTASGCPAGTTSIAQQTSRYLGVTTPLIDLAASTLSGAILSQDNDVESETGGLYTYDRRVLKVDPDTVRAVNAEVLAAGARGSVDDPASPQATPTSIDATLSAGSVAQGSALSAAVTVVAEDGSTPDGTVTATVDDSAAGDSAVLTGGRGTLPISTTGLEPGDHHLVISYPGSDNGYAASTSESIAFTVTKPTPPNLTFVTPASGAAVSGSVPITVSVEGQDLVAYNLRIDSTGLSYANPLSAGDQTFTLDTTTLANGSHTLSATATNAAGAKTTITEKITVENPASWSSTAIYTAGAQAAYHGDIYTAAWWTRGETPGSSNTGAWQQVGDPVVTSRGTFPTWTSSWIYDGSETVAHNGHLWQAKWWTRSQEPGAANGPWKDLGAY